MGDSIFGFDTAKSWDYENGYYLTSHPSRMAKAIAHWEIFKKIVNVPGAIVECGVFKGASLIRFAAFRELLENSYSRKIIGFDAFGTFPATNSPADSQFIEYFEKSAGGGIPKEDLERVLNRNNFDNVELIKGNILQTLPAYLGKKLQLKISLLHIDVDVYDATKLCLEYLFDRVSAGGVIVLDDYGDVDGVTRAVDEFMQARRIDSPILQNPYYSKPCYIVKGKGYTNTR